ncbi:uncharacterized protein [Temnothorax nylanderi]|uniref:uncharacterized protein n=1 Tax=Temnothorax nylanderi TaxID=102681 RepID=UPI003A8BEC4E
MIKIFISSVLLPHLVYTILIVRSTTETIRERNTYKNDECGITSYYTDSTNNLIANGEYALPGQWPWVVALNLDNQFGFQCAGSILTNRHILTVYTNCTNNEDPTLLRKLQETCTRLWSDQIAAEFYDLSNRNTFCAGCLGESGPCYDAYGSVGSGLVLFNNSTGRYHLLGVKSEFYDDIFHITSINLKYSVYVDVAQYLSWIEEQISTT